MTNSERPASARTTGGTSWSYAPPPAKQTSRSARARFLAPSSLEVGEHVGLGLPVGHAESAGDPERVGHGGEELLERLQAQERQHLLELVVGVGQVVGPSDASLGGQNGVGTDAWPAGSRPR